MMPTSAKIVPYDLAAELRCVIKRNWRHYNPFTTFYYGFFDMPDY